VETPSRWAPDEKLCSGENTQIKCNDKGLINLYKTQNLIYLSQHNKGCKVELPGKCSYFPKIPKYNSDICTQKRVYKNQDQLKV